MVEHIDNKCGICGDEKVVLNPIAMPSIIADLASSIMVIGGYFSGDQNAMLAGMAFYQASNGLRA